MHRASVLIPTHEHAATLPFAVASVQAQGIDDIEILIVGDGVTGEVRTAVEKLQASDSRIRFFDRPKGPRNGESHRDDVVRQAQGRIVCYQCDDDLWLPGHLEAMETALADADFAGAMHVNVDAEGRPSAYFFDLTRPEFTLPWLAGTPHDLGPWASNGFGLAFAGHTLDAYRWLPEGWTTTPDGMSTDQFMWRKFLRQPWCRPKYLAWPISLHFSAPDRRAWTPQRRAAELERWSGTIATSHGRAGIHRDIMADLGDRLLQDSVRNVAERSRRMAAIAELERARPELERARAELARGSKTPRDQGST